MDPSGGEPVLEQKKSRRFYHVEHGGMCRILIFSDLLSLSSGHNRGLVRDYGHIGVRGVGGSCASHRDDSFECHDIDS
jgi:hypothetical protein